MKRFILFMVLASVLIQSGVKTYFLIGWKIYQKEITEKYCINKSRPEMQCNGQCYLAKQMKKLEADYEKSRQPFPPKDLKSIDFILFVQPAGKNYLKMIAFTESDMQNHGGFYLDTGTSDFQVDCFHPPCLLS